MDDAKAILEKMRMVIYEIQYLNKRGCSVVKYEWEEKI